MKRKMEDCINSVGSLVNYIIILNFFFLDLKYNFVSILCVNYKICFNCLNGFIRLDDYSILFILNVNNIMLVW